MKFCHKLLTGLEKPCRSAARYTFTALLLSLALSLVSIFMVWLSNTPFFDLRAFLADFAQQIQNFRLSVMLILVGLLITWSIFKRETSTTLICALLIKLITGSYMTALITSAISRFMVLSGWFDEWTDYLPWSSMYPSIALPLTVMLWGGTLWAVLILRNHVKAIARDAGREHVDVYDRLGRFLQRQIEHDAQRNATDR